MFGFIQTKRLRIRPLEERDIYPLFEYRHLDEIKRYQSWDDYSIEKATELVRRNKMHPFTGYFDCGNFAVEYHGEMIGDLFIGVNVNNPQSVSIGYTFHPAYHHMGFAREAVSAMIDYLFMYFKKNEIDAYVMEGNVASMRLLISLGFQLIDYDEKYGDYFFRLLK